MAKAKRNDEPARLDKDVLREARIVAAYRGIPVSEYLSEILRPIVAAHHAEHARETAEKGTSTPTPRRRASPPPPAGSSDS